MQSIKKCKTVFLISLLGVLLIPNHIYAQFPDKEISIVVPYRSGGSIDKFARMFAFSLQQSLNTKLTVINKPGDSGAAGWNYARTQKPDGYTLTIIIDPTIKIITKMMKYRLKIEQFKVINIFAQEEYIVVKNPKAPYKSLGEINNSSKEIKLAYGPDSAYYAANALKTKLDSEARIIQLHKTDTLIKAILAREHDIGVLRLGRAADLIISDKLIPIAILSDKKSEFFPDVPTAINFGINAMSCVYYGLYTQVKTPEQAIDILRMGVRSALKENRFADFLKSKYMMKVNYTKQCEDDTYPCDTGKCCKD